MTPYEEVYRPPAVFLTHAGVTIWNVYKYNDLAEGPRTYSFTPDIDQGEHETEDDEAVFDVRVLSTWKEPEHPPFLSPKENDTPENRAAWQKYHADGVEAAAIRAAVCAAIDQGLLKNPPATEAPSTVRDEDLAVYFTPEAVREHTGDESLDDVTDDDLREAARDAPHNELLWKVVGPLLTEISDDAKRIRRGKVLTGTSPWGAT